MRHSYGGWCFACNRPTCQFNSPEQEENFYKPIKSSILPLINIEKPITFNYEKPLKNYLIDLGLNKTKEDKCTCKNGYNMFCPEHGISRNYK